MKANKMKISLAILSTLLLGAILLAGCYVFLGEDPPDPTYVPVQGIYGVPTGAVKNSTLPLLATVYPANATNQNITWSVTNDGGTGASFDRNVLKTAGSGTITVRATIVGGGATRAQDYTSDDFYIDIFDNFYAVKNIANVPTECAIGEELILTGTVRPSNATNSTITWALKSAGGTGAELDGHTLKETTTDGTVVVTATIQNGKGPSENYTQDFIITVKPPVPVVYVAGTMDNGNNGLAACYWEIDPDTGIDTLHQLPLEVTNDSYAIGAVFESGTLYIAGYYWDTVNYVCLWVVQNGVATRYAIDNDSGTSDQNCIAVSNGKVYITGYFHSGGDWLPVYWEWDTATQLVTDRVELPFDYEGNNYGAYTTGIAVSGSTVYVTGQRDIYGNDEACYWISNGTTATYNKLPGDPNLTGNSNIYLNKYDYYTRCIAVMGSNVYIMGNEGDYWSSNNNGSTFTYHTGWEVDIGNGEWPTYIGLPIPAGEGVSPDIRGVTARDGKWYAVGNYYDNNNGNYNICCWENGVYKELPGGSDGEAIAVQRGVTYVAGYDFNDGYPCYWIDGGTAKKLSGAGSDVYAIAVGFK